jgi:hypothetical protein
LSLIPEGRTQSEPEKKVLRRIFVPKKEEVTAGWRKLLVQYS